MIGESRDGSTEKVFGQSEFAAAEMDAAEGIVAPAVARITPQGLPPVRLRRARGVMVLLEVKSGQIKLIDGYDFPGSRWFGGRDRGRCGMNLKWRVAEQDIAV